jgi:hypothetical protein
MKRSMKFRATLFAGAALVATGAFTAALGEEMVSHPVPTTLTSTSGMTLGDTATTTVAPSAIATPVATPVLKATVPCGFTSSC